MKLNCLIFDQCIIPAAFVSSDARLQASLFRNERLLSEGAIRLNIDRRFESLSHMSEVRTGNSSKLLTRFDRLSQFSNYDGDAMSRGYRSDVLQFIDGLIEGSDSADFIEPLLAVREKIISLTETPSLNMLMRASTPNEDINRTLNAAYRFYFCKGGATSINGGFSVPEDEIYYMRRFLPDATPLIEVKKSGLEEFAHHQVFQCLAIDYSQLSRLPDYAILELKQDGVTRRAIRLISEISAESWSGLIEKDGLRNIQEARRQISARVEDLCIDEASAIDRNRKFSILAEDVSTGLAGLVFDGLPFWNTAKKMTAEFGRVLSRKTGRDELDFTITPVTTFAARLRREIAATRRLK